jgi:hypothetical protein
MICSVLRDTEANLMCELHLQKARTCRLMLAQGIKSFGGTTYPVTKGMECTAEQKARFEMVSAMCTCICVRICVCVQRLLGFGVSYQVA